MATTRDIRAGLLGGVLDPRTQEQLLKDKQAQFREQSVSKVRDWNLRHAGDQQAAELGAQLGAGIANRFNPPSLTEQEAARAGAVENATRRFKTFRSENPDADIETLSSQSQRFLAEELLRNGDPAGIQLAAQYAEQRSLRRREQLELERIGLATDVSRERLKQSRWDAENERFLWRRGELQTVFDPTNSDDLGRDAFIDSTTGAAKFGDGSELPLGEYTSHPPSRTSAGRRRTLNELGIGTIEQRETRNQMNFVAQEMRSALRMKSALEEAAVTSPDGSINILGQGGNIASWVTDQVDNLAALGRSAGQVFAVTDGPGQGKDLSDTGNALAYARSRPELVAELAEFMPPAIRNNQLQRERWVAASTQLAFARALAAEPGARQVSDQDFQVRVREIGSKATQPEAFRRIMLENIADDVQAFRDRIMTFDADIQRQLIPNPRRLEEFFRQYDAFNAEFEVSFGTAATPGAGLTGTTEQVGGATIEFLD